MIIDIDARRANTELTKLDKNAKKTDKSVKGMTSSLMKIGLATAGIYAVSRAFTSLIKSSFEYNIQMDASESKLKAMISSAKSWTTVAGKQVAATERMVLVNREASETMELLKKANSETAMGMTELIDVFALMKPGMDSVNVSTKDQIEILKLLTNTASNYGMTAEELATGIDDLATGTWTATSGFGKMAKSLGITKAEVKSTGDLVGYLEGKLGDVGKAQANWATAVSNLGVAWDEMASEITKPIFEPIRLALVDITDLMGKDGVGATEAFSEALKEFAKIGVEAIGFVIKAVSQLVHALALAVKGYEKLGALAGIASTKTGGFFDESRKWFKDLGASDKERIRNARVLSEETANRNKVLSSQIEEYNKIDDSVQAIIKSNNALNGSVDQIGGTFTKYLSSSAGVSSDNLLSGDALADKPSEKKAEEEGKKIGGALGKGISTGIAGANISDKTAEEFKKINEVAETYANMVGDAGRSLFDGLIEGTNNWGDVFENVAKDIVRQLTEILVLQPLIGGLTGSFSNILGGGTSGALSMFASGGIVNSPTLFSDGGTPSIMGEAGAEAIMPVTRMSNGDMGVKSTQSQTVVNVNNYTDNSVDVQDNGQGEIDIIISKVADSINRNGIVGQSIQSRYGIRMA